MDIVLFILMLLILLAEILFFQGNTLALIFAVVFCVLYLMLRIFLGKKLQGVKGVIARSVVLALIGVCIFQLGIKGTGGGFILYAQDMDTICGYLHQEEYDKAAEKLEELKVITARRIRCICCQRSIIFPSDRGMRLTRNIREFQTRIPWSLW